MARALAGRATAAVDFAELLSVEQTRFKLQAVSQAAKGATPVDLKKEKPPKDTPVAPKADWIPKKEYLAKLAAERAAKAAADSAARPRSRSRRVRSRSNRLAPSRRHRASSKREPMRTRRRRR